jgi:hypothetical protein
VQAILSFAVQLKMANDRLSLTAKRISRVLMAGCPAAGLEPVHRLGLTTGEHHWLAAISLELCGHSRQTIETSAPGAPHHGVHEGDAGRLGRTPEEGGSHRLLPSHVLTFELTPDEGSCREFQ